MRHLGTKDVTFAPGFQTRIPFQCQTDPLPSNSLIKDFQQGKAGYVANAIEQALLLPDDMANLRTMKRHKVFLGLKRDLPLEVRRKYCLQVWNETFNLAGVEASSTLKRTKNVYYPPAIQAPDSSISQDDATPKDSSINEIPAKDLPPSNSPPKGAEQAGVVVKEKENPKEVASETTKPPIAPKGSFEGGVVS